MFLKEFCPFNAFCFGNKITDTKHKQANKYILNIWGESEHNDSYIM